MNQGIIKPLIPEGTRSPASLRQFADALRKKDPAIANAFERAQQSLDRLEKVLRAQPEQSDEMVITDPDGNVIGWIGARDGYWGAWFGQIYAGGTGPVDSMLFIDNAGVLNIRDAYISLTSGTKSIIMDPTYPVFQFNDAESKFEISGTGGGTHQVTLSIVDDSDPNLYTAYLSSQGILRLVGYTHQAAINVTDYGSDPTMQFSRAGGTVATPAAPGVGDRLGGMEFNAYDTGTAGFLKVAAISANTSSTGTEIVVEDDTGAASVVIDPANQTVVFNDATLTATYQFDVKGAALFRNSVDVDGAVTLNDTALTASRPLKIDSSNIVVTGLVDVNDANDIAATGFATGDLAQWDGTKFAPLSIADLATALASYFAAALHTHTIAAGIVTDSQSTDPHSHTLSAITTGEPD